jgi:hypothetical protein
VGVQSQNNPVDGLALHPVKSVAASPQQVSLFLAQPEHLEQGSEKNENVSEFKIQQAIDGRHLKECNVTYLLINAACLVLKVRRGGAIPPVHLWLYGVHVDTFMFILVDLIKIVPTVFWSG